MMEPWENGKNPTLILNPIWGPIKFFQGFHLDNVPSYHPMQFLAKLINLTWKSNKKPNLGPNFGWFDPNLHPKFFFMDFTSTST